MMFEGDLKKLDKTTKKLMKRLWHMINSDNATIGWTSIECMQDIKRPLPLPGAKKISKKETRVYQKLWKKMNKPEYTKLLETVKQKIKIINEEETYHEDHYEPEWDQKLISTLEDRTCDPIIDRKKEIFIIQ